MTRKLTRNTSVLRGIAPFVAVLIVMAALAVLAQTRGAGRVRGTDGFGDQPMNSGPRLFVPAVAHDSGGYNASAVAVGDVNGDGKLDLAVGNECASSGCPDGAAVGVLLGKGDGTFLAAVTYHSGGSSGPFFPVSIVIADVNGDHKPDVVVANGGSGTVGVLLGNGDGTFQPAVTYGSGGAIVGPLSVAVADVNGDGKPDLLVANQCADNSCDGSVGMLLGNGDGTFRPAVTYSSGGLYGLSVAVADVNGDGKPDLLVANGCASSKLCGTKGAVAVLLGNGDGTFQAAIEYLSGGAYPYSLKIADLNGDGKLDVVAANSDSGNVGVLLGNGNGTFQKAVTYSSGETIRVVQITSVAVADVNGDGHPDLLLTTQNAGADGNNGGEVALLLGNGDGTFQGAVNYPSGGYQLFGVAVGDVNGDGRPDVLLANSCIVNNTDCGPPAKVRGVVGVLLNNVGAPPTATTLVPSANPGYKNQVVTYTATVTSQSGGALKGTVLFQDGAAPIATVTLAGNQAAYSTTYPAGGTHSIAATYSGVLNTAAGSASDVLTEIILPQSTTTKVVTSGSPTFVGQPVTFTATVTSTYGPIPDGELVTFYDGTIAIGTGATASGVAKSTTSSLTAKTHTITATYAGDMTFAPSSGTVKQMVKKYPTTTTLTSSPNPSAYGQAVTFTATVKSAGPTPTGNVTFKDGTIIIGHSTLSGGTSTLTKSNLAVGTHPITAHYPGDAASGTSTSAVVNQVVQ
jgi:Bacterial Ig-like domain (group 3)/FG-GAP-like repeat/FG-GAP repeat